MKPHEKYAVRQLLALIRECTYFEKHVKTQYEKGVSKEKMRTVVKFLCQRKSDLSENA